MARGRRYNPLQPRDYHGRWVKAAGSAKKPTPTRTRLSRVVGSSPGRGTGTVTGKGFLYKEGQKDWTAASAVKPKAKRQRQPRPAAAVPYVRINNRGITGGIDAGAPVGKKFRVVAGGYVKIERTQLTRGEKDLATVLANTSPLARAGLRQALSKQVPLPKGTSATLGTSSSGLPSIKIRKGASKVPGSKHASAVQDFEQRMQRKLAGQKVKKSRPQRRKKNPV